LPRRRNPLPPRPAHTAGNAPIERGVLELDRFSEKDVNNWNNACQTLDEIHDILQYALEPERRKYRKQLLDALNKQTPISVDLSGWARIVSYKYGLQPLSCAGSLQYVGGRFNAGVDLEPDTMRAWPALYIAEDFATAFLEKFQINHDANVDGLSPQELALNEGGSHSTVILQGRLTKVFDMTEPEALNDVAKVFGKIKMPPNVNTLKRKLGIPRNNLGMISTGRRLFDVVTLQNWRILPVQYGLPSNSQILAGLIKSAGFEAIQFKSTKGAGKCIAVFPEALAEDSYVELTDASPPETKHKLLNIESAAELAGWDSVAPSHRDYR
jgi:RES domain